MKIRLIAILATFSIILGAGIVFLSPNGQAVPADKNPSSIGIDVKDDEGDPIPGAAITVERTDGTRVSSQRTDASGQAMVHFPSGGAYRVRTTLPAGYSPIEDSDSTTGANCAGLDPALCISTNVAGGRVYSLGTDGQFSNHPIAVTGRIWVKALDQTPEPRLHIIMRDRQTGQVLKGGTLSVNQVLPTRRVFNNPGSGDVWLTSLTAADYDITWTPPTNYVPDGAGPIRVGVNRLTLIELWAKPKAANSQGANTTGGDEDVANTGANVYVRDARTGSLVEGGVVRWTWLENRRMTSDQTTRGNSSLMVILPGSFVVELLTPPTGYSAVGQTVTVVNDGTTRRVNFTVQRNRVVTGTNGSPTPTTTANGVGGQTPPTTPPTTAPATTTPPTTTAPPTTSPETTTPPEMTTPPTTAAVPPAPTPPAPSTTAPEGVGSALPRCDLPENYEICLELGLIEQADQS